MLEAEFGSWPDSGLLPERGGILVMLRLTALEQFLCEAFEISDAVSPVK